MKKPVWTIESRTLHRDGVPTIDLRRVPHAASKPYGYATSPADFDTLCKQVCEALNKHTV